VQTSRTIAHCATKHTLCRSRTWLPSALQVWAQGVRDAGAILLCFHASCLHFLPAPNGSRYPLGEGRDSPSKRDSAEARKMPKNAGPTPSRVHAVLGGFFERQAASLKTRTTAESTKFWHEHLPLIMSEKTIHQSARASTRCWVAYKQLEESIRESSANCFTYKPPSKTIHRKTESTIPVPSKTLP
jgi:hypothetical protein